MPESIWVWEEDLKRYRDTQTGRFIGIEQMNNLRSDFFFIQKQKMGDLANQYSNETLGLFDFEKQVKQVLKDTYIDMYAMGKGGRNNLTQSDWGKIGAMLKEQYGQISYLANFMRQIANGDLSEAQIAARLNMYINSANEALWRGFASDLPIDLPAYPGDGSTQCLTNCQCTWDIRQVEGGYDCYWVLGYAEHCPDCIDREQMWSPYTIRIEAG